MNKIFLGGTCNETTWRETIEKEVNVDMFNPVVKDWTSECQEIEKIEKEEKCNIHLYVITSAMTGVFSIAEVLDSVHNKEKSTIFQVIPDGFTRFQLKSLQAVIDLVNSRGGCAYMEHTLKNTIILLNTLYAKIEGTSDTGYEIAFKRVIMPGFPNPDYCIEDNILLLNEYQKKMIKAMMEFISDLPVDWEPIQEMMGIDINNESELDQFYEENDNLKTLLIK